MEALLAVAVAISLVGIWLLTPRGVGAAPRSFVAMIAILACSSLLPGALAMPVQALALLGAIVAWLLAPTDARRGTFQVSLVFVITAFWAALLVLPNVPSLEVGLLGIRKSTWAMWGLVLGASVSSRRVQAAWRWTVAALVLALSGSVGLFLFFPTLAKNVAGSDDADLYTGLIGGEMRMHGIFAGPFHAALAGVVLVAIGIALWSTKRWLSALIMLVGVVGIYLTLVRTAYVAVGLMVATLILVSPSVGSLLRRAFLSIATVAGGVIVVAFVQPEALSTVASIGNAGSDDRFLNRIPGWLEGLAMVGESPIFGWGPGSAGDVMGQYFLHPHRHITAHNLVLKFAVEGGLIGLVLVTVLAVAILRSLDVRSVAGLTGVLAFVALLGLGLTVSSIEALPVSYLLFVLVGLALPRSRLARGYRPEVQETVFANASERAQRAN